jgi:hypothetical protein
MTEGHPGSAGWAAFEARMRDRRFSRCIEHATTGLQTGAMEEVRDALDEARILRPDAPEIAELESRIAALPSPSAVLLASNMSVQEPPAGWLRVIGAMCVLVLLFGLFGFGLAQLYLNAPTTLLTDAGTQNPHAAVAPNTSSTTRPLAPDSRSTPSGSGRTSGTTPDGGATTTPAPQHEPKPEALRETVEPRVVGTSSPPSRDGRDTRVETPKRADEPAASTLSAPRLDRSPTPPSVPSEPERWTHPPYAAAPPPAVPAVSVSEAAPVTDPVLPLESPVLSPSAAPPRAVPASTASASRETAAVMTREGESAQIRMLLSRYETAYNRLDAAAASSLWPGIDRAALDRAFKGLISQRVSLGLCDITVIGDIGGASCAGKARWEPRVGGGLQTADRYWTFNLRKSTEGWRIEQIRVRE